MNENENSEYLRESVRLAELRMTEQDALQSGYERKAVLLITFCTVITGYLFVGEWAGWLGTKLIPVVFLVLSAYRGMQVLQFAEFGIRGLPPEVSAHFSSESELQEHILGEYVERIDRNQGMLTRQYGYLEKGRVWLYWGLGIAFVLSVLEKIAP